MSRKKNTAKSPAPANKPAAEAKSAAKPDCSARERLIRGWFSMWLKSDEIEPEDIFADDAVYTESDGSEYHGVNLIANRLGDWFRNGVVKRWDITGFTHSGSRTFVEWHFECVRYNRPSSLDGISVVEFDGNGKICSLREFSAEHERTLPYGD